MGEGLQGGLTVKDNNHFPQLIAGMLLGTLFGFIVMLSILSAWMPHSVLNHLFSNVCHQQAERSHSFGGHAFGICIRCFWLYMGLSVGSLWHGCTTNARQPSKSLLIGGLLIVGISWLSGWILPALDWFYIRIFSSLTLGYAISQYAVPGMAELLFSNTASNKNLPFNHESKRARPAAFDH